MLNRWSHFLVSDFWTHRISCVLLRPVQFVTTVLMPGWLDLRERFRHAPPPDAGLDLSHCTAYISPSLACNARCVFCAYSPSLISGNTLVMPQPLFEKAVDQIAQLGITRINLTPAIGEILMDDRIFDKIAYARSHGMRVDAFTNGLLLLKNDFYRALYEAGLSEFSISLSDLDPEIEAANYRISVDSARHKMEGIRKLAALNARERKVSRLFLSFRPSRHPYQITRHPFFRELCQSGCEYSFLLKLDNWGGAIQQAQLRGIMRLVKPRRVRRRPCLALDNFSILPDGSVRLCGCRVKRIVKDDLVVGNITDQSLQEILQGPRIQALRRRFYSSELPEVCETCAYYGTL